VKRDPLARKGLTGRLPHAWRQPLAIVGGVIAIAWLVVALAAPVLAPHDPLAQDLPRLAAPGPGHWFGTDQLGRDILSRVMHGARVSIPLTLMLVALSVLIGGLLGACAGYFGRWVDETIMRVADLVFAFPTVILAMVVAAALGASLTNAVLAVLVVAWPAYAQHQPA
jgi:peptide/nickel transport system permease protein